MKFQFPEAKDGICLTDRVYDPKWTKVLAKTTRSVDLSSKVPKNSDIGDNYCIRLTYSKEG